MAAVAEAVEQHTTAAAAEATNCEGKGWGHQQQRIEEIFPSF